MVLRHSHRPRPEEHLQDAIFPHARPARRGVGRGATGGRRRALPPATLAQHLGLKELVEEHLDLGPKPGRANVGDKLLILVFSALAGGDAIDDANALRAGGTSRILGFTAKAASTVGTFLRSFR